MIHEALVHHLRSRLIERATGSSEETILDNRPRDVLFAGCLTPRPDAAEDNLESAEDFFARLAPSAIQLRFLARCDDDTIISVRPHLQTYHRIIPPFEAQLRRTRKQADGRPLADKLIKAYRRCIPELPELTERAACGDRPAQSLAEPINTAVHECVATDTHALRLMKKWQVPASELTGADVFYDWCGSGGSEVVPPHFSVDVHTSVSETKVAGIREITVSLVNRSTPNEAYDKDEYWDQSVFDVALEIRLDESALIEPYRFTELPNSYRFDRRQWGSGTNCVAEMSPDRHSIRTRTVPTFEQPTLEHRELPNIDLRFHRIAEEPLEELGRIPDAMRLYREESWLPVRDRLAEKEGGGPLSDDFERDLADFEREIDEVETGLALLRDPERNDLQRAFRLMNETFARMRPDRSWRLFQIVFIVRNLPVLAGREWPDVDISDDVEVLWFPTGGGKTEAFLGLAVTALFFDRLRGRKHGVTALIRLPLRLLSLQQFQRVVEVVTFADMVRKAEIGGRAFSVGYWIGRGGSPNKVEPYEADRWEQNPAACQQFRKIRKCPYCGGDVRLRFDRSLWALLHHCDTGICGRDGDLPLYIVDDEIYRFLPSVIVGTVDKLAAFGFQQRFANLFGWPVARCEQHGFTPRNECLVPGCNRSVEAVSLKDPVPSMHIQDELHLLKEDLGAFDGHYETALLEMQKLVPGGRPWKLIAATATIEQYDWHVDHLYCKPARRFPCPGPSWKDTFYATTVERLSRVFLGFLPFHRSHINAMISVLWHYHHELLRLRRQFEEDPATLFRKLGLSPTTAPEDFEAALRDYELSLIYVLTRKAGDQMAESLTTQVAGYLRDEGEEPLAIRSLTGQNTGEEIEALLADIERSATRPPGEAPIVDAVTATSMISHGVDVERFNFIAFFGMPRLTAEYIQASSRVARAHPGFAVTVFSPARERDRSHFHLFPKYHEYLERLVEPAAINRWARYAVRHTLPGIFIGYLINVYGRQTHQKLYMENQLHAAINDGLIPVDELIASIQAAYRAELQESGVVKEQVRKGIELFLNGLRPNARRMIWKQIHPMMSLRDVEEPVFFTPSNYSKNVFDIWMTWRKRRLGDLGIDDE